MSTEAAGTLAQQRVAPANDWFGQPRGLTILFLTDMWEQFSYFGMRALLVYYMVKQLLLGQERASLIYGLYTAFVYFTPIIGGVICDRWLGRRNSVLIGGSIMALGHFMMAFEPMFFVALATIGIGNGLFLPSLPSQINGLYAQNDPRRRTAYNYYYLGVNVGAFLEGTELSSIRKMAVGAGVVAFSYLLLAVIAALTAGTTVESGWIWLVAFFIVMTAGELYILPIGLGLFGRLAPLGFSATTIALWFAAGFFGNLSAGAFGTIWSRLSPAEFFALTGAVAALSGASLLFFNHAIQRAGAD